MAPVSSAAPKRKAFDRGGPVWPPRSNAADDRLWGGLGGAKPPSQKPGGLGGSAPQPKTKNFELSRNRFLEKALSRKAVNSMLVQSHVTQLALQKQPGHEMEYVPRAAPALGEA